MGKITGNNLQIENVDTINDTPIEELGGGGDYIVYCLVFPNSKKYIGITSDFKKRMREHKFTSKNKHSKIYCAIRKYGWENVKKEVLFENMTIEEAENKEIDLIKTMNLIEEGYNLAFGGRCSKHSKESIEKMKKIQSTTEAIERKSKVTKEIMKCPERRKISSKNLMKYNKSEEHSKNLKNRWLNDSDYVEKMKVTLSKNIDKMVANSHTPQAIQKRRKTIQKRLDNGEIVWTGRKAYKKVICLETNELFDSVKDCSEKMNLSMKGVRRCVTKERKSYKGFTFNYL